MGCSGAGDHLVDEPGGAVVVADELEDVAHVRADGARVGVAPLELVHEAEALAVEVDGDEVAVGVEDGRPRVAADGVGRVEEAAGRLARARVALEAFEEGLRRLVVFVVVAAPEARLFDLVEEAREGRPRAVFDGVGGVVALDEAGGEAEGAVAVGPEALVGVALLEVEEGGEAGVAVAQEPLARVADGGVERVGLSRERDERVVEEALGRVFEGRGAEVLEDGGVAERGGRDGALDGALGEGAVRRDARRARGVERVGDEPRLVGLVDAWAAKGRFNVASTWLFRARAFEKQQSCFETVPRDDHSSKSQPKRVENDRDTSL